MFTGGPDTLKQLHAADPSSETDAAQPAAPSSPDPGPLDRVHPGCREHAWADSDAHEVTVPAHVCVGPTAQLQPTCLPHVAGIAKLEQGRAVPPQAGGIKVQEDWAWQAFCVVIALHRVIVPVHARPEGTHPGQTFGVPQ
jgi:hypothetical protein